MDIQKQIATVWPQLHAMAEPAFQEVRTAKFVADRLRELGYTVEEQGLPCGRVKLLFQPAEEIGKGALVLLEAGALDDVQYALGYHVMPKDMARSGQIIPQINWTACTLIEGEIRGLAAHGSQPHLGINAIDVGTAIVNAVNAMHSNPLLGGSFPA